MISLYRVIGTVEAYVLAEREEDACERMQAICGDEGRRALSFAPTETARVTEGDLSPGAAKSKPMLARFIDPPKERAAWTCAQWGEVAAGDAAVEAERLLAEASKAEERARSLRARALSLTSALLPRRAGGDQ